MDRRQCRQARYRCLTIDGWRRQRRRQPGRGGFACRARRQRPKDRRPSADLSRNRFLAQAPFAPRTRDLILLTHSVVGWFMNHYMGDADINDWRASPARVSSLAGLPPAYVLTAGADPLRDEGDEYAERLRGAGVPVTYRHFPGQFHGFFTMGKLLQQANLAASAIGVWLKALN